MIKVLVVDDSAVVRQVLTEKLSQFSDIEVVGSAIDPYAARDKILQLEPDVITLDIEMPRMDGLSFLKKLMRYYPLPVVIVSSLTPQNSENAMQALALGAVEVVSKPGSQFSIPDVAKHLVRAIRAAASARIQKKEQPTESEKTSTPSPTLTSIKTTHKVIAIGASTGGTRAIEDIVTQLPPNIPGTIIVQHMPPYFTKAFADRLNQKCQIEIREAADNDYVVPGVALIAPGGYHMVLQRSGARYYVRIKDGPAVHHQKPAVDVLFRSVAEHAGRNALGVILTGMGADGAKGMLTMREAGAYTIAQDEKSCIVFGMPKEAIKLGAVQEILPLSQIVPGIIRFIKKNE